MKYRKIVLTVVVEEREEEHNPEYKASYEINGVFFKHLDDGRKRKSVPIESCGILKSMREIISSLDRDITGVLKDEDDV